MPSWLSKKLLIPHFVNTQVLFNIHKNLVKLFKLEIAEGYLKVTDVNIIEYLT